MKRPDPQTVERDPLRELLCHYIVFTQQEGHRRRYDALPGGGLLLLGFAAAKVPKELLPELFELGATLEKLPRLRESRSRTDPNVSRANRLIFEIQEALFVALTRLLAYRTLPELTQLTECQRAFLRRAIFRTADASFVACALLVLGTIQDRDPPLETRARELAEFHPSERIREAASEYLHALAPSLPHA